MDITGSRQMDYVKRFGSPFGNPVESALAAYEKVAEAAVVGYHKSKAREFMLMSP